MRSRLLLVASLFWLGASPSPATSQALPPDGVERGFTAALKGCEAWVLDPGTWADNPAGFAKVIGLEDTMGLVASVDEAALPPAAMRRANRYWRINSTPKTGYILVVSDQLPMCHITGGGATDLQPAVARVLASSEFAARWEAGGDVARGGMTSTPYRNRSDPKFSIMISHASSVGGRLDRVQVLATAIYDMRQ